MNFSSSFLPFRAGAGTVCALRSATFAAAVGVILFVAVGKSAARADEATQAPLLDIAVRSAVDRWDGFKKKPVMEHGKKYFLAGAKEIKSEKKLVRPVNEVAMLNELRAALKRRGFIEIEGDQVPDVVLTVKYGRGALTNPYLADASFNAQSDPPTSTINGAFSIQLVKEHEPQYEAKLQKANFEKLYIYVSAWQYPKPEGKKAKEMWQTTMIVDDPQSRDLNLVYKQMFTAGSAYFDRPLENEEVEIDTQVPEGRVEIGDTTVVAEPKKK
ncbi:MAG: hypothetical protein JWM32_2088 [Verrucomicrobia bacterium]|nr:hypothetical protein [Verrucomicrobiota bacterium]